MSRREERVVDGLSPRQIQKLRFFRWWLRQNGRPDYHAHRRLRLPVWLLRRWGMSKEEAYFEQFRGDTDED